MENTSPLYQWHVDAGAKMADFGGWDMPIEYPKVMVGEQAGGVLAEHASVRDAVGIFDVSHLGKISITGEGAVEFLNAIVTNDLSKISNGSSQYNLLCNEQGGVIDDLIVYRKADDNLFLIPNAANCADVFAVIKTAAPAHIDVKNIHKEFGVLALQGPRAADVIRALGLHLELDYTEFTEAKIPGHEGLGTVLICRTGYTGEFGYELLPSWNSTLPLWKLLNEKVSAFGGRVCGLGARDTLRTEMAYPLHGHELSLSITPLEASANWAIALDKSAFHGQTALKNQKAAGLQRRLRGLKALDRGIPRAGMQVMNPLGEVVGEVTSGTFSPTLKNGIGLALLSTSIAVGDKLTIDVRGRISEVEVVKTPFVEPHVR
jgi:aminomethyltransferase